MRIPSLLEGYCLSICSADYNEWIWKNVTTRHTYSYLGTGEYEMFEFDLGNTFNYAELAALVPRQPYWAGASIRSVPSATFTASTPPAARYYGPPI